MTKNTTVSTGRVHAFIAYIYMHLHSPRSAGFLTVHACTVHVCTVVTEILHVLLYIYLTVLVYITNSAKHLEKNSKSRLSHKGKKFPLTVIYGTS